MSTLSKLAGAIATLLISGSALSQRPVFEDPYKVQTAIVRIRAISTSVHAGTQNRDAYLAEVLSKSGEWQVANLIDVYAAEDSRISPAFLKTVPLLKMKMIRSPFCDLPQGKIFLSENSIIFDNAARSDLMNRSSTPLPCYRMVHRSVRVKAKHGLHSRE